LTQPNPSLQFAEGQLRGYVELTVTPKAVTADYYGALAMLSWRC
jgi:alkaline phosphatase D